MQTPPGSNRRGNRALLPLPLRPSTSSTPRTDGCRTRSGDPRTSQTRGKRLGRGHHLAPRSPRPPRFLPAPLLPHVSRVPRAAPPPPHGTREPPPTRTLISDRASITTTRPPPTLRPHPREQGPRYPPALAVALVPSETRTTRGVAWPGPLRSRGRVTRYHMLLARTDNRSPHPVPSPLSGSPSARSPPTSDPAPVPHPHPPDDHSIAQGAELAPDSHLPRPTSPSPAPFPYSRSPRAPPPPAPAAAQVVAVEAPPAPPAGRGARARGPPRPRAPRGRAGDGRDGPGGDARCVPESLLKCVGRLAKRDALGDARSSDEEDDRFIHHPFHVKDKPLPTITLNIRNAVPLPVRTPHELAIESAKLRTVFPVSSGTQHRFKEIEWKPVEEDKKSTEIVPLEGGSPAPTLSNVATVAPMMREEVQESSSSTEPLAIEAPPDNISVDPPSMPDVDISSVIGLRLKAMRALQENPECNDAKKQLLNATSLMKSWADAKALEPKFLTPAELSSGPQAWAKRDQLRKTTKLDSGMGMHLLQKMGWRPGEGLGKNKEGQLEPLALDVKTDKKGLTAAVEELMFGGKKSGGTSGPSMPVVYDLSGKHPVSALMELTAKRRWGAPEFEMCFEHGPPHKRQFVYKVIVNGVEYQPCVAVGNKKQAKANAAAFCLQSLGLLPTGSVQANELLQTVQKDESDTPIPEGTVNALGSSFNSTPAFLQTVKTDDQLMPPPKLPT
ncbi:Protein SON [Orchesella cincta]|uniref:Protein SON n=1 Tax=Orchesella cincta TaxID=48709 RepID=A0A1D2NFN7_ORCCI|nr:Protein SON [Orchesella cincta]